MSEYQKRGLPQLAAIAVAAVFIALARFYPELKNFASGAAGAGIVNLFFFIKLRLMTEEEYAARRKKEKKANDERAAAISGKAANFTLTGMIFSLAAACVWFAVKGNEAAYFAMGLQLVVMLIFYIIGTLIYRRKI